LGRVVRGLGVGMTDESIYNKHRDDLIRYAAVLVGWDRAEDVLSTVVLRVLSGGGLTRLAEPRPYLFKAVLNEARSVLRARTTDPLPDMAVEMGLGDFEVLEAVMGLPARQRAAVFLVFWGGETIEDAARLMGARAGTVRRYLHLAKRRLKEWL